MEPTIPTSFIPKRPIESSTVPAPYKSRSVGLLSLITIVVVLGTIGSFAGVYLYEKQLVAQKAKLEQSLIKARDGIGTDFVADMKRLDLRIAGVKELIKNHIVVNPIFKALEESTLRSIQYRDFGYSIKTDGVNKAQPQLIVDLTGVAKNYASIALQSDAFSTSKFIKNPVFSNLTVDDKNRTVNFKLTFNVDMADLSYQTFVDSLNKKSSPSAVNNTNI